MFDSKAPTINVGRHALIGAALGGIHGARHNRIRDKDTGLRRDIRKGEHGARLQNTVRGVVSGGLIGAGIGGLRRGLHDVAKHTALGDVHRRAGALKEFRDAEHGSELTSSLVPSKLKHANISVDAFSDELAKIFGG